jgi:hypothetical protein
LLDYGALVAGKMRVNLQKCSLSLILSEISSIVLVLCVRKKIKFEVISSPGIPDEIYTDQERVK